MRFQTCPRPSYGRVLGSDVVSSLVLGLFVAGGTIGSLVLGAQVVKDEPPESRVKRLFAYGVAGGAAGFLVGLYPSLLAQRAVVRDSPDCPVPSMGRLVTYSLVRHGALGALTVAGRAAGPPVGVLAQTAGFFLAPLVGQALIKS